MADDFPCSLPCWAPRTTFKSHAAGRSLDVLYSEGQELIRVFFATSGAWASGLQQPVLCLLGHQLQSARTPGCINAARFRHRLVSTLDAPVFCGGVSISRCRGFPLQQHERYGQEDAELPDVDGEGGRPGWKGVPGQAGGPLPERRLG